MMRFFIRLWCSTFHRDHHVFDYIYGARIKRCICKHCTVTKDEPMWRGVPALEERLPGRKF